MDNCAALPASAAAALAPALRIVNGARTIPRAGPLAGLGTRSLAIAITLLPLHLFLSRARTIAGNELSRCDIGRQQHCSRRCHRKKNLFHVDLRISIGQTQCQSQVVENKPNGLSMKANAAPEYAEAALLRISNAVLFEPVLQLTKTDAKLAGGLGAVAAVGTQGVLDGLALNITPAHGTRWFDLGKG